MKKQTGIWLDLRNAWVINLPATHDGEIVTEHIASEIEENAAIQNTRMETSFGPHGGNNQRTVEERLHHEEKQYFLNILKHIHPSTEELIVFGPSEAKHGLKHLLENQHNGPKLLGVVSADHMTEHQIIAWVRDYFGRPAPRKMASFGQVHKS